MPNPQAEKEFDFPCKCCNPPKPMVMTCRHVIEGFMQPEYHKEDDCYTCKACRDSLRDDGFEAVAPLLCFIHKDHFTKDKKIKEVLKDVR